MFLRRAADKEERIKGGLFRTPAAFPEIQSRIQLVPRYRRLTSSLSSSEVQSYTSTKDFYDVPEDNYIVTNWFELLVIENGLLFRRIYTNSIFLNKKFKIGR